MIINPTVKAMPLFNKLEKVAEAEAAKVYCAENPFYSWHAHYTTINRFSLNPVYIDTVDTHYVVD